MFWSRGAPFLPTRDEPHKYLVPCSLAVTIPPRAEKDATIIAVAKRTGAGLVAQARLAILRAMRQFCLIAARGWLRSAGEGGEPARDWRAIWCQQPPVRWQGQHR